MKTSGLKNIVESIIFASEEVVTAKHIKDILDVFKIESSMNEIENIISELNKSYDENDNAFEIIKISAGYQFATKKKYSQFIGKLYSDIQKKKLSQSAIETLSIIAYKQPITRSEIEFIRGVNVDYIVNSLLERDLITIKGRADGPGRPILYGTTHNFLKVLGLNALEDLPKLKEINEILKNEKVEGISEADIDLFNSVNQPELKNYAVEDNSSVINTSEPGTEGQTEPVVPEDVNIVDENEELNNEIKKDTDEEIINDDEKPIDTSDKDLV